MRDHPVRRVLKEEARVWVAIIVGIIIYVGLK